MPTVRPHLGISDDSYAQPSSARSIVLGWLVIVAVVAPVVVGAVVAGENGALAVMLGYLVLMFLGLLTMLAEVIGGFLTGGHLGEPDECEFDPRRWGIS
jgi:hypothetical protein